MGMGTSTGNDSTFENLINDFSQVEQDENKNVDEQEVKESIEDVIIDALANHVEKVAEIANELGVAETDVMDATVRAYENDLEEGGDMGTLEEWLSDNLEASSIQDYHIPEDDDSDSVGEDDRVRADEKAETPFSPNESLFNQTIGNFRKIEDDLNKNVDEGTEIVTPAQSVTPFEKVLESCQHALDEKEEVEELDIAHGDDGKFYVTKGEETISGPYDTEDEAYRRIEKLEGGEVDEEAVPDVHAVAKDEDEAIRVKHPLVKDEKRDKKEEVEEEVVKEGLADRSDNIIFITKSDVGDGWQVYRTREGSSVATSMFTFDTEEDAATAGEKIANAIGGEFRGTDDPRIDTEVRGIEDEEKYPIDRADVDMEEGLEEAALKKSWSEFSRKHDFNRNELDRFAKDMGFKDFEDMEGSVTVGALKKKDPEKFEEVLSGFVGTKDDVEEAEVKEDVVDEEAVADAHIVAEEDGKVEEEVLDEKKLKDFDDNELKGFMQSLSKMGSWERVSSLMDEVQDEIGRREREKED